MRPAETDRRTFLARVGLFSLLAGAAVAVPTAASALNAPTLSASELDLLRKALNEVSRDTYNALAAFAVPGTDAYSREQGTPRPEAGGIDAKAPDFMLHALDNFVPFPDELIRPLTTALAAGTTEVPLTLAGGLLPGIDLSELDSLGAAVDGMLANDEALPLSGVVALVLNFVALQVNPASKSGSLRSPFARLSYAEKAQVIALLEGADAELIAQVDGDVPEPLRELVSGISRYIAGSLLAFTTFASYSEWATFSADSRSVTSEPVGWRLSQYDPGSLHGWDDFQGYYQNREKVSS